MGRICHFLSICLMEHFILSLLDGHSAGVVNRTKTLGTQLINVTRKQNGNYTCLVKNQSGENGSRTIELEMKGETLIPISQAVCQYLDNMLTQQRCVIVNCAPWS